VADVFSSHSMLSAYDALAARCWEDPAVRRRLIDAPRDALAAYGWDLPGETSVRIEIVAPGGDSKQLAPEQIVEVWRRGIEAGELTIKIVEEAPAGVPAGGRPPPTTYPA
jgi:hypothetical protein